MTIRSEDRKAGPFLGDGLTKEFPFDFKVFDKEHLVVLRVNTAGAEEELALGSAYTVTLNADQEDNPGGVVILSHPLAIGEKLVIVTDEPYLQLAELANMGGFFPKTVEGRLDYLTVLAQLWRETFKRAMLTARSDGDVNLSLGAAAMRANRFLAFDAQGNVTFPTGVSSVPGGGVVVFDAAGDGLTDVTTELQAAINSAAGSARLYLPPGVYLVSATIRIPSHSYICGAGIGQTIIKMASHVGRDTTVVLTGSADDQRTDIILEDFTIDANEERWDVAGGSTPGTVSAACALSIVNTHRAVVRRVSAINAHSHGIDVTATTYGTGGPTSYDPEPSRFVWLEDCHARNNGDDNITTHQSSDIWITRCVSEHPSGARVPGNSNCFEIDDGSRNVYVTNCVAIGGDNGLQIKGHNDKPAPYNIVVDGFRAVNNQIGVEVRHTGWYSTTDEDLADETVDENGDPFQFTGASPNARNLILSNITIIAPANLTTHGVGAEPGVGIYGFRLRSYENVLINNLLITDGSLGADDYAPFVDMTNNLIRIYSGARHVVMRNVMIYGFPNIVPSGSAAFWVTGSFAGPMVVDGLTCINGPADVFRASGGAGPIYLNNYFILGDHNSSDAITLSGANKRAGQGIITGYDAKGPRATGPLFEYRAEAGSSLNEPGVPREFGSYVWDEGTRDLGQGEGIRFAFKCNLENNAAGEEYDGVDYEFGTYGFRKESGNDQQALHEFFLQLISATDGSPPRDVLIIRSNGSVHLPEGLPEFSDDSDAASGGVAVGQMYRTGSTVKIRVS